MFVKFPFGTEIRQSQQNHGGGWPGFGMATVGIHPNDFDLNPNKIPTGGVVQNSLLVSFPGIFDGITIGRKKLGTRKVSEPISEKSSSDKSLRISLVQIFGSPHTLESGGPDFLLATLWVGFSPQLM